ncbi:MAG: MFS transporter, partial [Brevundimonas sp.]
IAAFERARAVARVDDAPEPPARSVRGWMGSGLVCAALGVLGLILIGLFDLEKELLVLAGFFVGFGLLMIAVGMMQGRGVSNAATEILNDIFRMPETMRGLAVVQFFSWFALFAMWIYTTAAVTSVHYGATDTTSAAYAAGADWVGVLFGVYNGVAALAAFALPPLAKRIGKRATHALMLLGALGLFGVFMIREPGLLWLPMIGVGFAWASIVSMPYAILAGAVPDRKMGVYMGVFNIFIVVPQLLAATVLGLILKSLFDGQAIWALVLGAVSFVLAALAALRVKEAA